MNTCKTLNIEDVWECIYLLKFPCHCEAAPSPQSQPDDAFHPLPPFPDFPLFHIKNKLMK